MKQMEPRRRPIRLMAIKPEPIPVLVGESRRLSAMKAAKYGGVTVVAQLGSVVLVAILTYVANGDNLVRLMAEAGAPAWVLPLAPMIVGAAVFGMDRLKHGGKYEHGKLKEGDDGEAEAQDEAEGSR